MMRASPNTWLARGLIVLLMAVTLLPFLSMLSAALAPQGTYPNGLQWPADPQWGNFVRAFEVARMDQLLLSSTLIVLGVVPIAVLLATMAGYGLAKLTTKKYKWLYLIFVFGLTLPFEAVITPLYYEVQGARPAQHPLCHHPAAHRPLHALRCLLDAGALPQCAA